MSFGVSRLVEDLNLLGFSEVSVIKDNTGQDYARIANYQIPAGSFAGRIIDLAIPAPAQYPQLFGASIHLKASPHLVALGNIPNVRNVLSSNLGVDWQYWSYCFHLNPTNPTSQLLSQINGVFRKN
jgi:hypothetical protein